jgi:hypothetical protein
MNQFPHSVRDEYGMECPECKRDNEIVIYATQAVEVMLLSDGTTEWNGPHDTEWEDESRARCIACGWTGTVDELRIVTEEVAERKLQNEWRYAVQCCDTFMGFEDWKEDQVKVSAHPEPESGANSHSESLEADSEWFIVGPGHMYWSVDEGWVSAFTKATIFDNKARQPLDRLGTDFPTDGKWEQNPVTIHKSEMVREVCKQIGIPLLEHKPVEEGPTEYKGYPYLGKSSVILQDAGMSMSMWKAKSVTNTDDIAALLNNILWHLENCASEPDGGGAAYMAKELAKLIGRKE